MIDRNCESRIDKAMREHLDDLRLLWTAYQNEGQDCPMCDPYEPDPECPLCGGEGVVDQDGNVPDLGTFYEYGLAFDYVPAGTFGDQDQGYFRYQLSWGGPSDEFRFYADPALHCYQIEYWFLDWNDGARRALFGNDRALLQEIWEFFVEVGSAQTELDKAA